MAVTWIVTVTVPPEAIVTEPAKVLPVSVKLLVEALALTWLEIWPSVVVNWLGKVSLKLLVSVDGPALVTTKVKLVVAPTATVEEPTVLLGLMLTTLVTVPGAVAVLLPLLVVPVGINTVKVLV